jgi:hypothetical protein
MKGIKLLIALAALTLSGAAVAGAPFTFVDLGYVTSDSGDERTDGFALRGSFGFGNMWHVGLGAMSADAGGGKSKAGGADVSGFDLYVGLHPAITDNLDLVVDLGYQSGEVDDGSFKDDVTAIFLRSGPRVLFGDKLELSMYVIGAWGEDKYNGGTTTKVDFTEVGLQVGTQYYFTPAWSVGADANFNRSVIGKSITSIGEDSLSLFVRWSFGK